MVVFISEEIAWAESGGGRLEGVVTAVGVELEVVVVGG